MKKNCIRCGNEFEANKYCYHSKLYCGDICHQRNKIDKNRKYKEGYVECLICNIWYRQITHDHLLNKHNIRSVNDYILKFPEAKIMSKQAHKLRTNIAKNNPNYKNNKYEQLFLKLFPEKILKQRYAIKYGNKKGEYYQVDFFEENTNTCYEIDSIEKDLEDEFQKTRTNFILSKGYKIVRYNHKQLEQYYKTLNYIIKK